VSVPTYASGQELTYFQLITMANNNATFIIQKKLSDIFSGKPYRSNVGTLDFLFSPANGSQMQANLIGKPNGKNTRYVVTRRKTACTAVVTAEPACTDAGTDVDMTDYTTYDSFDYAGSAWHNAPISSFRDLGSLDIQDVMAGFAYDQMGKIKDAVSLAGLLALNTNAGYASASAQTKKLKLIDDATKSPVWNVDTSIKLDFADAGFPDMPILIGNRSIAYWKDTVKRASINNNGLNVGAIDTLNAFYDINVNATNTAPTEVGNDVLFAVLPQVANIITWSANTGIFASRTNSISLLDMKTINMVNTDNTTFMFTTIADPATGMVFDYDIVFDPKCKKFQWRVGCYYKVVMLPLIGCKDSNFNGIVKYDVCPLSDVFCNNP
jgi:hypothetical protein